MLPPEVEPFPLELFEPLVPFPFFFDFLFFLDDLLDPVPVDVPPVPDDVPVCVVLEPVDVEFCPLLCVLLVPPLLLPVVVLLLPFEL